MQQVHTYSCWKKKKEGLPPEKWTSEKGLCLGKDEGMTEQV